MITLASGVEMQVDWFSRQLRGVGVLAMPNAGLDAMRRLESASEVPLGADVLRLLVPGIAVGVLVDSRSVVDGVEVTH